MCIKSITPLIRIDRDFENFDYKKAQYQVALDSSFNTVVYSSEITNDLKLHKIPDKILNENSLYYLRMRVLSNSEIWSDWSEVTEFYTVKKGEVLGSFETPGIEPLAISIDPVGNLISTDAGTNPGTIRVHLYITESIINSFYSPGDKPSGIAVSKDEKLISFDKETDRIYIHYKNLLEIEWSFYVPSIKPQGIAVDPNNNLISCSKGKDQGRILIHNGIQSEILDNFHSPGGFPIGLAVDSSGNLISADFLTNRIYVHDGISPIITSSFSGPGIHIYGITVDPDSGDLIVIALDKYKGNKKFFIIAF